MQVHFKMQFKNLMQRIQTFVSLELTKILSSVSLLDLSREGMLTFKWPIGNICWLILLIGDSRTAESDLKI